MTPETGSVTPRKGNYFYQLKSYQDMRVYGDEIFFPDIQFVTNRTFNLCDRSEWWAWPAAVAWNKLRRKLMRQELTR